MDTMAAIRETFFQECAEQLAEIEAGLSAIDEGEANAETVNAVFRAVHSIKGGAGAFQLDRLVRFAHAFETTLDRLRSGKIAPSESLMKTMFRANDALSDLVVAARSGGASDEGRTDALVEELKSAGEQATEVSGAPTVAEPEALDFQPLTLSVEDLDQSTPNAHYTITFAPRSGLYRKGNEPMRLLRELSRLGEMTIVCDASGLPKLEDLDPEGAYLVWRIELGSDGGSAAIEEVFDFVVDDCDLAIVPQSGATGQSETDGPPSIDAQAPEPPIDVQAPETTAAAESEQPESGSVVPIEPSHPAEKGGGEPPKREAAATATIRVDLERVDRLINLVGELVINQAMLSQKVMDAGLGRASGIATVLGALEQLTREIQEGVMATRAQPVKPLFQRMARIVRELAEETGKSVRLRTEGERRRSIAR
jgi:two-component system chemotaxis sensor kinase CheA